MAVTAGPSLVFTSYDKTTHGDAVKTTLKGLTYVQEVGVPASTYLIEAPRRSELSIWGSSDLEIGYVVDDLSLTNPSYSLTVLTGELYAMSLDGYLITSSEDFEERVGATRVFDKVEVNRSFDGTTIQFRTRDTDFGLIQPEKEDLSSDYVVVNSFRWDGTNPTGIKTLDDFLNPNANDSKTYRDDGSIVLSDIDTSNVSRATVNSIPTTALELAKDGFIDILLEPWGQSQTAGQVTTINGSDLTDHNTRIGIVIPTFQAAGGWDNFILAKSPRGFDSWIDTNTGHWYGQAFSNTGAVIFTLKIENFATLFPTAAQLQDSNDYLELVASPVNQLYIVTDSDQAGMFVTQLADWPYLNSSTLPGPADYDYYKNDTFMLADYRDFTGFDANGNAQFDDNNNASVTHTGGIHQDFWISGPGDDVYTSSANTWGGDDLQYENSPSGIVVDYLTKKINDGWGGEDDFSGVNNSVWIDGSFSDDEFKNVGQHSFRTNAGDDWIHSFVSGGAWIELDYGADFVDTRDITSTTSNKDYDIRIQLDSEEVWQGNFLAKNVDGGDGAIGTQQEVKLVGYGRFGDVVLSSEHDVVKLEINNGDAFTSAKGVAVFADDMFTRRHTESGAASDERFASIEGFSLTSADDIIDLTSSTHQSKLGDVNIEAKAGNDIIWGGSGNETIDAGDGDDIIFGGKGSDILSGGWGSDIFEFTSTSGSDTITDFNFTDDKLRLYSTTGNDNSWTVTGNTLTWGTVDITFSGFTSLESSYFNGLVEFQMI